MAFFFLNDLWLLGIIQWPNAIVFASSICSKVDAWIDYIIISLLVCIFLLCNSRGWGESRGFIISLEIHLIFVYCPTRKINYKLFSFLLLYFFVLFSLIQDHISIQSGKFHANEKKKRNLIVPLKMTRCFVKVSTYQNHSFMIFSRFFEFNLRLGIRCQLAVESRSSHRSNGANQWKSISFCGIVCAVPDGLMNCFVATLFNQPITNERTLLAQRRAPHQIHN